MPKHEFGIMKEDPVSGKRFEEYEPQKYDCITVDDDYILPLLDKLADTRMYWHSVDDPGRGLAYCGITLIPPCSIDSVLLLISCKKEFTELTQLLSRAKTEKKYVIHFGI